MQIDLKEDNKSKPEQDDNSTNVVTVTPTSHTNSRKTTIGTLLQMNQLDQIRVLLSLIVN